MNRFLTNYVEDGGRLSLDRLQEQLRTQTQRGLVYPVFFGSARTGAGIDPLMSGIADLLPASAPGDPDAQTTGTVFKIERGAATGEDRIRAVVLGHRANPRSARLWTWPRRQGDCDRQLCSPVRPNEESASAGNIAKIWGLRNVQIGDRIGLAGTDESEQQFAPPTMESVVEAHRPADRVRLRVALGELAEQDPFIKVRYDDGFDETSVSLYGEVQKEVIE